MLSEDFKNYICAIILNVLGSFNDGIKKGKRGTAVNAH